MAGYLFDPKFCVVDPSTHQECPVAFFTFVSTDEDYWRRGLLGHRTALVRLRRCFRPLGDEGIRPLDRHRYPPAAMLPQRFQRPAPGVLTIWHANPEGRWYPGYAFRTQQTTTVRGELVKIGFFAYFSRCGHHEAFHHDIWRVRAALCRWSSAARAHELPDFEAEDPLPQLAGLSSGKPTRSDLDWDMRHLGRVRPHGPPRGDRPDLR